MCAAAAFSGSFFLGLFWLFNALMLWWLIACWRAMSRLPTPDSEAGRMGAAAGATLATGMIFFFWVAGTVMLGLFVILTRGGHVTIEEEER